MPSSLRLLPTLNQPRSYSFRGALQHPAFRLKFKMPISGTQPYLEPLGCSSSERTFYEAPGLPAIRYLTRWVSCCCFHSSPSTLPLSGRVHGL